MRSMRHLLVAASALCLAACVSDPPEPDMSRVRCVELPHGLVECNEILDEPAASAEE